MSGTTRAQRRVIKGDIDVFPAETSLGWRVIRQAGQAEARKKLAIGEWREVQDQAGNFIGCQVLANFKKDEDLPSGASSTSISPRECELNAAGLRQSRTARLPEERKIARRSRFGRALPPEDAIERAVAKVNEFGVHRLVATPLIGDISAQGNWNAFPECARVDG